MNLMLHLNLLENKLKTLSRFQKVQLFLLPIVVVILIVLNFIEIKNTTLFEAKKVLEKNIVDTYDFLKHLEEFALKNELTLLNIKQDEMIFNIEIKGDFSNIVKTIYFCESYESVNDIESLKLNFIEDSTHLQIYFRLSEYKYKADEIDFPFTLKKPIKVLNFNQILNEEKEKKREKEEIKVVAKNKEKKANEPEKKKISFEINAIVNNEVLINNEWIKENETILEHRVLKIDHHFVVLINEKGKKFVLKLLKE